MAASLVTTVPVLIIFLYLQKYMVEGLSFGSMD
jgi:multiple sugar transport system permease protein